MWNWGWQGGWGEEASSEEEITSVYCSCYIPAVTVRRSLLVLGQRLFKKSSLCLEERPVLLEHLLLQLQRSLSHSTHVTVTYTQTHTQTDRQRQTDRQTDRHAGTLTHAQHSLNIWCSFTHSNNCSLLRVLCCETKPSILMDEIPAAEDNSS